MRVNQRHSATRSDEAHSIKEWIRSAAQLGPDVSLPELRAVAQHFCITPRTLQRRLRECGTTFRQLSNEVRLELANEQLASSATVLQVAEAAGFAEVSSFHRAFKRWTGQTPKRFVPSAGNREY
jgi:AraC-like DNA-binding protein